jgi:uncharacterized protein YdaL
VALSGAVVLGASRQVFSSPSKPSLPAARAWSGCATGAPAAPPSSGSRAARTLVVADDPAGLPISRVYAALTVNLASHFGPARVVATSQYRTGLMRGYQGVVYLGTAAEQTLPDAFRRDVAAGVRRVLWLGANVDKLAPPATFAARYGWRPGPPVTTAVRAVRYRGAALTRDPADTDPLPTVAALDRTRVTVLGTVVAAGGRTWPWALRSGSLTYVGEPALDAAADDDRYLAVADLLFDLLAPGTPTRHRALVRLEDIGPEADPKAVRAAGELLHRRGVPFSFGVFPVYRGPLSEGAHRRQIRLAERPELVRAIHYLLGHGGTMVLHGYSHQTDGIANPDNGESGQDFEFFRTHRDRRGALVYDDPVAGDSGPWMSRRIDAARAELGAAHLPMPRIIEVPHYAASVTDYRVIARRFAARYDRGQYFSPAWNGRSPASPFMYEQYAPYLTRDVYGSVVVPENLGFVQAPPPARGPGSVAAILAHARTGLVVRDNVASFFYHPFLGTRNLAAALDGMRALGYRFVSPCALSEGARP